MQKVDVLVIGAGAAGLMCALNAGYRGRTVTVVDMGKKPGRKIIISGGGRCNFTNQNASPENFLCHNPHFVKSALSRYTQYDFIEMVERHGIDYHHKTLGQLFCDNSAHDIVEMLTTECEWAGVTVKMQSEVLKVESLEEGGGYQVTTSGDDYQCESLVIASGGLTMPKLGASPIGYKIAEQFGLNVLPTCAALVPFTLHDQDKARFDGLSGISVDCEVTSESGQMFRENILFTHRGLSGPAILQISSYWQAGQWVSINLLPEMSLQETLQAIREKHPQRSLKNALTQLLPKRLIEKLDAAEEIPQKNLNQLNHQEYQDIHNHFHHWQIKPNGTEGYRTAEVTLGGVDSDELSSKTLEAKKAPGLYFIGEVTEVTGWLGGYNFQWAWSSGWAAGQVV
ncbi:NAD(P)/FAD-dependent oxidoreductase [Thalassotalea mangrovi]|uniref:NAD(P)/FAD-dependent oxidoreductase n=1 Tax=Thalassotalea mangrovi TaxID=2572245 RepID=A0A4U1B7Z5_9GAMM|nr:NAD(P)/FAD-dependent oxidoreductase [Thalassotalea mangrovi]TKB46763.1 NAD(P)/FAD-dependent oxidoreductase [Thalassotalea mangrovi]